MIDYKVADILTAVLCGFGLICILPLIGEVEAVKMRISRNKRLDRRKRKRDTINESVESGSESDDNLPLSRLVGEQLCARCASALSSPEKSGKSTATEEPQLETSSAFENSADPAAKECSNGQCTEVGETQCGSHTLENLKKENEMLSQEVDALRKEKIKLKEKLAKFTISFENMNDAKLRFYTGLPSLAVFMWVFSLVGKFLSRRAVVSGENQLLLTLMKLRHGLQNKDLAYRFCISASTVSDIICQVIPALAVRLSFMISWPTKEIVKKNLPKSFYKQFRNCRVIIDCTEVFIERPYNLKTRAKTWSNYKSHNTLKCLVGITPYGAICFVSEFWGGRVSDKEITERSGFYQKVEYGDQIMADRGFTISNELARRGATLVIPPFTKGRKQLPGIEVERARQLSALRIHVERAIERIKNFKILSNVLPLTLVGHASDIVKVCASLANLSPKLIK